VQAASLSSPPLNYDGELQRLLSDADRNLARLDALATLLTNPDLFVAMYVRQEAVLSSQQKQGPLEEMTGQTRNRVFRCQPYLTLFENQALE
jgi:hypothetical protein